MQLLQIGRRSSRPSGCSGRCGRCRGGGGCGSSCRGGGGRSRPPEATFPRALPPTQPLLQRREAGWCGHCRLGPGGVRPTAFPEAGTSAGASGNAAAAASIAAGKIWRQWASRGQIGSRLRHDFDDIHGGHHAGICTPWWIGIRANAGSREGLRNAGASTGPSWCHNGRRYLCFGRFHLAARGPGAGSEPCKWQQPGCKDGHGWRTGPTTLRGAARTPAVWPCRHLADELWRSQSVLDAWRRDHCVARHAGGPRHLAPSTSRYRGEAVDASEGAGGSLPYPARAAPDWWRRALSQQATRRSPECFLTGLRANAAHHAMWRTGVPALARCCSISNGCGRSNSSCRSYRSRRHRDATVRRAEHASQSSAGDAHVRGAPGARPDGASHAAWGTAHVTGWTVHAPLHDADAAGAHDTAGDSDAAFAPRRICKQLVGASFRAHHFGERPYRRCCRPTPRRAAECRFGKRARRPHTGGRHAHRSEHAQALGPPDWRWHPCRAGHVEHWCNAGQAASRAAAGAGCCRDTARHRSDRPGPRRAPPPPSPCWRRRCGPGRLSPTTREQRESRSIHAQRDGGGLDADASQQRYAHGAARSSQRGTHEPCAGWSGTASVGPTTCQVCAC